MHHCLDIKVRGYHLDVYGHVNNARYLEFLEEARWTLLDERVDLKSWQTRGIGFNIVNININYRRAAVLNDELLLEAAITRIGDKSATLRQSIRLKDSDHSVVDADVTFVIADTKMGKLLPIDGVFKEILESLR